MRSTTFLRSWGGASTFGTKPKVADLALRIDQIEKSVAKLVAGQKAQSHRGTSTAASATSPASATTLAPLESTHFTELYEFSSRQPSKRIGFRKLCLVDNEADLRAHTAYVSREVKIRLAHAAAELAHAPFGFSQMEAVKKLRYFHELSYVEIAKVTSQADQTSVAYIGQLCAALQKVYQRHHITPDLIAEGIREFALRNNLAEDISDTHASIEDYTEFQHFLETVICGRVRIRFLIGNYIAASRLVLPSVEKLAEDGFGVKTGDSVAASDAHLAPRFVGHDPSTFVGAISRRTSVPLVANLAVATAREVMSQNGAVRIPEVTITVHGDAEVPIIYPPRQAFNMISSLVSHGMKQEMRRARDEMRTHTGQFNPVEVLISQKEDNNDVVVRIRDRGGGIPPSQLDNVFSFLHSARATDNLSAGSDDQPSGWMKSTLRLPYAAVLTRTFGGDLTVTAVDGESTTKCLFLPAKGLDAIKI